MVKALKNTVVWPRVRWCVQFEVRRLHRLVEGIVETGGRRAQHSSGGQQLFGREGISARNPIINWFTILRPLVWLPDNVDRLTCAGQNGQGQLRWACSMVIFGLTLAYLNEVRLSLSADLLILVRITAIFAADRPHCKHYPKVKSYYRTGSGQMTTQALNG